MENDLSGLSTEDIEGVVTEVERQAVEWSRRFHPGGSQRTAERRLGLPTLRAGYAGGTAFVPWMLARRRDPLDCGAVRESIYEWGDELAVLASNGAISEYTATNLWHTTRSWHRWRVETQGWQCDPYWRHAGYEFLRPQRRRQVSVLSPDELRAMVRASQQVRPGESVTRLRTGAVIALLVGTGCRIGEAAGAQRSGLRQGRDGAGQLEITASKRAPRRTLELPAWAVTPIRRYLYARDQDEHRPTIGVEPLFAPTSRRMSRWRACSTATLSLSVREVGRAAGVSQLVHPHLIRHSTITHMLAEGFSREYVAAWSGHSGPAGLEPYDHRARQRSVAASVAESFNPAA